MLLRIDHGSKEASFLSAFCPIDTAPTLVVIDQGRLIEKLEGGVDEGDFKSRLQAAVGISNSGEIPAIDDVDEIHTQADMTAAVVVDRTTVPEIPTNVNAPEGQTSEDQSQPPSNVQSLLNDRAQRLEADRIKREKAERAERIARANARRREAQDAEAAQPKDKGKQREGDPPTSEKAQARRDWVRQQKQRNDEAKRDRERVLQQIENDRLVRKEKELQRRQLAKQEREQGEEGDGDVEASSTAAAPSTSPKSSAKNCALQIRLFDGSSIRSRFAPSTTLSTGVRTWISSASPQITTAPYTFRLILAPQPSRSIEISEESQSLQELGLLPTATLVLIPVAGYTEAYASAGYTGMLGRGLSAGFGLMSGAVGLVGAVVSTVSGYVPGLGGGGGSAAGAGGQGMYMGGTADESEASNVEGQSAAGSDFGSGGSSTGGIKVRTLADQRARDERERRSDFYNGNSLDFEPRKDDDGNGGTTS